MSVEHSTNESVTEPRVDETRVRCTFECDEDLEDPTVRVVADTPEGEGELHLGLGDDDIDVAYGSE